MKPHETKKDIYHKKSKIEGYRARSAYKLIQINERFNIFNQNSIKNILDLGCAPGSWPQVLINKIGNRKGLKIMGVDYKRMGPIEGVKLLSINVFSEKFEKEIESYFPKGLDLILSDMAPKISGVKSLDSTRTIELIERAYDLSDKYLNKNGNFIAKVFQCSELNDLLKNTFEKNFQFVKIHKPKASRKGNRELYIIAKGYGLEKKGK
ncbi:MAG: RlmE family RNA methyltransferase [archaeon]|nr:RlmE family RNA methyltransferase [archaeon]